jgi:hypothetical protein
MPFGEPDISEASSYTVTLKNEPSIPDSAAVVSVTVTPADEGWTTAGLDALFQQLLDHLAGASFLVPANDAPVLSGNKNQRVNTLITPTPEPEPEP